MGAVVGAVVGFVVGAVVGFVVGAGVGFVVSVVWGSVGAVVTTGSVVGSSFPPHPAITAQIATSKATARKSDKIFFFIRKISFKILKKFTVQDIVRKIPRTVFTNIISSALRFVNRFKEITAKNHYIFYIKTPFFTLIALCPRFVWLILRKREKKTRLL